MTKFMLLVAAIALSLGCASKRPTVRTESVAPPVMKSSTGAAPAPAMQPTAPAEPATPPPTEPEPQQTFEHDCG